MIDIAKEKLLTLEQARNCPLVLHLGRDGKPPMFSTVWKWCRIGIRGIKLEVFRTPSGYSTSEEAIVRFFQKLSEPAPTMPQKRRTEKQKQRAVDHAKKVLAAAGI